MKTNWPIKKLGEIAELNNGRAFKSSEWLKAGLPIIRIQNLNNGYAEFNYFKGIYEKKIYISKGDLLFSWSGSLGTSFGAFIWDREPGLLNQHIYKVILKDPKVSKEYLFFFLNKKVVDIEREAHGGVGLAHITKKKLINTSIVLPEFEEQKRIVAKLEKILAKIEKSKKIKQESKEDTQKILAISFNQLITKYAKSSRRSKLSNILLRAQYGTSAKANGGSTPILRMPNIQSSGDINYSGLKFIDLPKKEEEKYILKKGDILINRTNSLELLGKAGYFDVNDKFVFASYLIRLDINPLYANSKFVNLWINSKFGREYILKTARQTAGQANINAQEIGHMPITLPEIKEQEKIVTYLDGLSEKVQALQKLQEDQLQELERLKQSVLHQAFQGKL